MPEEVGSGINMREVGVEIKKELVCCLLLLVIQSKTSTLKIFLLRFNATKALNEISLGKKCKFFHQAEENKTAQYWSNWIPSKSLIGHE